jgi:hypothetical protein
VAAVVDTEGKVPRSVPLLELKVTVSLFRLLPVTVPYVVPPVAELVIVTLAIPVYEPAGNVTVSEVTVVVFRSTARVNPSRV